jgi:hypothetical protein
VLLDWISSPRAPVGWYLGATSTSHEAKGRISLGERGFWAPLLDGINPDECPKTTGVTIEDTETKNCLGKVEFISAEGRTGAWAQQTHGVDHRSAFFIPDSMGPDRLYSDWSSSGAQSARNWPMLHLEFGGGVSSNFSWKCNSVNRNPELQAAKMMTHFDRKDCFPHTQKFLLSLLTFHIYMLVTNVLFTRLIVKIVLHSRPCLVLFENNAD